MMIMLNAWQRLLLAGLCVGLFTGLVNQAQAASFNVNPIGFDLSSERSSGVLQIRNTGDQPVRIQVEAVDWSTDGSKEVLGDTDALLLNPPIFTIEPNQMQFLRFGLRHPENSASEKSYRLLIDEVPQASLQGSGLKTLLRISIPVFIGPKIRQEKISWQLKHVSGALLLSAANEGNVHGKINRIMLRNAEDKDAVQIGTPAYILPGQRKEWSLANGKIRDGAVRLHIQTDKGEIEEHLTLEADQVSSR